MKETVDHTLNGTCIIETFVSRKMRRRIVFPKSLSIQARAVGLTVPSELIHTDQGYVISEPYPDIRRFRCLGILNINQFMYDQLPEKKDIVKLLSMFWPKRSTPDLVELLSICVNIRHPAFGLLVGCIVDITTDVKCLEKLTVVANLAGILRKIVYAIVKADKKLPIGCFPAIVRICKQVRLLVVLQHGLLNCESSVIAVAQRSPLYESRLLLCMLPDYVT